MMTAMLSTDQAILLIVDVQGKLAQVMHERDALLRNLQILIQGIQVLGAPILWVEQNPSGLGPTVPELSKLLSGQAPIAKMSFSAGGEPQVVEALRRSGRTQVILAGIEAHVCIYLTAADLLAQGYDIEVVADAVSSRTSARKEVGISRIAALGGGITCTETVLFELLGHAGGDRFRAILKLLK